VGTLDGRVALVTGGARGMGRTHAVRLAREGANVAILDICSDVRTIGYGLSTEDDLNQTAKLVEEEGRECLAVVADVRDLDAVTDVVDQTNQRFGSVDILLANAGISHAFPIQTYPRTGWEEMIGINLTGVFNSLRAVAPVMIKQRFGRIVATSSMMGRYTTPNQSGYCAAKWGVIGLIKSASQDLAPYGVTVNAVAPGNIDTTMVRNDALYKTVRPDLENPSWEDAAPMLQMLHVQPIPVLPPEDITEAIMFLIRSEHITGSVIDVNAGASARFTA
jgi:SDR family mycofactocin-dependent oxidoreductase